MRDEGQPDTLMAILRMGSLRVAQGNYAEPLALPTPVGAQTGRAFTGSTGRSASLRGLLGKARALAREPAEFATAEADLLDAHAALARFRGERDKETREWAQGLADLYAAWDEAAPGRGYVTRPPRGCSGGAGRRSNGQMSPTRNRPTLRTALIRDGDRPDLARVGPASMRSPLSRPWRDERGTSQASIRHRPLSRAP